MTRLQCKELQEAFNHFANGGNLWRYNNRLNEWKIQTTIEPVNKESNIIEDQHFEARKAYALGEEIEYRISIHYPWSSTNKPNWTTGEYRPKPKEPVYEWQYYYLLDEVYVLTNRFYTDDIENKKDWIKFKPSKRLRNDNTDIK
jgi:hypothetical protein